VLLLRANPGEIDLRAALICATNATTRSPRPRIARNREALKGQCDLIRSNDETDDLATAHRVATVVTNNALAVTMLFENRLGEAAAEDLIDDLHELMQVSGKGK
jgi:hypothetical protein